MKKNLLPILLTALLATFLSCKNEVKTENKQPISTNQSTLDVQVENKEKIDKKQSKDEIEFERLTKYFKDKGLDFYSFYKQIGDIKLDCIHIADKKYPDFGIKHDDYSYQLMEKERKKIKKKYKLSDDIFSEVGAFGMSYCK